MSYGTHEDQLGPQVPKSRRKLEGRATKGGFLVMVEHRILSRYKELYAIRFGR